MAFLKSKIAAAKQRSQNPAPGPASMKPVMQQAKAAMAAKQQLAAQQKAQTQFAKPVPLNNAGASMSKGAAAPKTQSGIAAKYGASSGMLKSFGAKNGGAVPSKMGAVKTNAKPDGVAKKGKTKGRMV